MPGTVAADRSTHVKKRRGGCSRATATAGAEFGAGATCSKGGQGWARARRKGVGGGRGKRIVNGARRGAHWGHLRQGQEEALSEAS